MVKWKDVVEVAREEAERYYSANGLPLTLRGLFYILVSKNVIPNTKSFYNEFSRHVARARYLGEFPWYLLHDKVRSISWGDVGQGIPDAQRALEELSKLTPEDKERLLKEYLASKYEIRVRQWEGQPYRVMVVVEKDALYDIVKDIVRNQLGWDVSITFSRGFESASQAKEIAEWVRDLRRDCVTPVFLLIYDFDPSGEYASIRDFVFRVLALASKEEAGSLFKEWEEADDKAKEEILDSLSDRTGVEWKKVMLTLEQVVKYNIPPTPENEEVKKKLERDPRKRWFVERYGGLYQAEVDALLALNVDEAKRILDEAIRKYFDAKIYEEVKKKEEELRKQVRERLG
jgi:hypothetical protein